MGQALLSIITLVNLVCFIIVIVKMFQNGQTGLGIATLLLGCCGIGQIIAFVYGWMRRTAWNLNTVMIVWTVALLVELVLCVVFQQDINQMRQQLPQQP